MRRSRVTLTAVALALALAACGNGDEASTPDASGADAPRYGGTLVVAGGNPGPLNPAITPSGTTHPVTGQIFNGLVRLDRSFDPTPDLAQRWTVSPDGRTYTFELARGVRWHDGQPFTSADVKFTYEQMLLRFHSRTQGSRDAAHAGCHRLEGADPDELGQSVLTAIGLPTPLDTEAKRSLPRRSQKTLDLNRGRSDRIKSDAALRLTANSRWEAGAVSAGMSLGTGG